MSKRILNRVTAYLFFNSNSFLNPQGQTICLYWEWFAFFIGANHMITVINTRVGQNRGKARIWLEGKKITPSFEPGNFFNLEKDEVNKNLILKPDANGTHKVSVRNKNNRKYPIIELRGDDVSFFDISMLLRVVVRKGSITIEIHGRERKHNERVSCFLNKLLKKQPLDVGSIFTGLGVLDNAVHTGLSDCGIESSTKFIVERESKYIESMLFNQPELFSADCTIVHSNIEDVEFSKNTDTFVDIIIGSLPCTGSSPAGRTKKKLVNAESDSDCGASFFYWLNFILKFKPLIIVMENVVNYLKTASMRVIESVLETFGYNLNIKQLNGNDFQVIENRDRMSLVAINNHLTNIKNFDIEKTTPINIEKQTIEDILENIPQDSKRWKNYEYLADKEKRDKINGNGFKRNLVNCSDTSVCTIRRLYQKGGSCDPFLLNKENETSRLFTPLEHARIKGIPEHLILGSSDAIAHEMLGQSVIYPAFRSLGRTIGNWINSIH